MICLQLCSKKERQFGIQIPHRPVSWNFLDGCLNHLIDYPQMSDSITTTAGWISKFWRNSENVRHISSCIIVPFVCIIYIYIPSPVVFPWGHFGQPILPKSHDDHPGAGVSGWRMLDAVAVKSCTEAWCGRAEESRWPLNAGRVGSNQPILFFFGGSL